MSGLPEGTKDFLARYPNDLVGFKRRRKSGEIKNTSLLEMSIFTSGIDIIGGLTNPGDELNRCGAFLHDLPSECFFTCFILLNSSSKEIMARWSRNGGNLNLVVRNNGICAFADDVISATSFLSKSGNGKRAHFILGDPAIRVRYFIEIPITGHSLRWDRIRTTNRLIDETYSSSM